MEIMLTHMVYFTSPAARKVLGRPKDVSQMAMVILLIADFGGAFDLVCEALIWISLALTIISLVDYVAKNRQVLTQGGM